MNLPPCPQGALAVRAVPGRLDPFLLNIIHTPPDPYPPPPDPPPPVEPPLAFEPPLRVQWTYLELLWWSLLCNAMAAPDVSYVRRLLEARGPLRGFNFAVPAAGSTLPRYCFAQLGDRFTIVIGGTDNERQTLQYVLTHATGTQSQLNAGYWNTSFASSVRAIGNVVKPAWEAEGKSAILIVGHSMGGAVAPALIWEMNQRACSALDRTVTFGAPLCFTTSARNKPFPPLRLRFTVNTDPITFLPPPRFIVQNFLGPAAAAGYPGGDYVEAGPRIEMTDPTGLQPLDDIGLTPIDFAARFVNFFAGGWDITPHFARNYCNKARAYLPSGAIPPRMDDFADYAALFTIDDELRAINL